jgi:hypothetical protein
MDWAEVGAILQWAAIGGVGILLAGLGIHACEGIAVESVSVRDYSELTTEQLLDQTITHNRALRAIDAELCRRAGVTPDSPTLLRDRVLSAVYDGQGWGELVSDLELIERNRDVDFGSERV